MMKKEVPLGLIGALLMLSACGGGSSPSVPTPAAGAAATTPPPCTQNVLLQYSDSLPSRLLFSDPVTVATTGRLDVIVDWTFPGLGLMVGLAMSARPGKANAADDQTAFRVRIGGAALAASLTRALAGAAVRLRTPRCAAIFTEFRDAEGRTLQSHLDDFDLTGADYLGLIGFYDGGGQAPCLRERTFAVTAPGTRVVWVCRQFALEQHRDPVMGEVILIHEALHSLGLGEDPPSATEITSRVLQKCAR